MRQTGRLLNNPSETFGYQNDYPCFEHRRLVPSIWRTYSILDKPRRPDSRVPIMGTGLADKLYGAGSLCQMSAPSLVCEAGVIHFRLDPLKVNAAEMEKIEILHYMEVAFSCAMETRPPFNGAAEH